MAGEIDGTLLSREVAGGYTGTILGLYASSNGIDSSNYADFDWFEYKENKDDKLSIKESVIATYIKESY